MPYPMNNSASSHIKPQVGSTYFISQLNEEHHFKCGKRTGRILDIGSGSVLVRWDSMRMWIGKVIKRSEERLINELHLIHK